MGSERMILISHSTITNHLQQYQSSMSVMLQVHLCEALRILEFLGDDFLVNRTGASSRSMLVAVKTLRKNAEEQAR